jgi:hypothetical protein
MPGFLFFAPAGGISICSALPTVGAQIFDVGFLIFPSDWCYHRIDIFYCRFGSQITKHPADHVQGLAGIFPDRQAPDRCRKP